jgi:hypothetical protein
LSGTAYYGSVGLRRRGHVAVGLRRRGHVAVGLRRRGKIIAPPLAKVVIAPPLAKVVIAPPLAFGEPAGSLRA